MSEPLSIGKRCSRLADENPHKVAVVLICDDGTEQSLTRGQLDERSTRLAHLLAHRGVTPRDLVGVALPNGHEHLVFDLAIWKLGACVLPLRSDLPPWERDRILAAGSPRFVIADWESGVSEILSPSILDAAVDYPNERLPDVVPEPAMAVGTGGSTGTPKIVMLPTPAVYRPGQLLGPLGPLMGVRPGCVSLVGGPLYHVNPFMLTHLGLHDDETVILMERFRADWWPSLVERYRINWMSLVPTMMRRILEVPGVEETDLSSITAVMHTAAPCPEWLKRRWIDLVGPERLWEVFGSSEGVGFIANRGDEWLQRPGTIGRPIQTQVKILDEHQNVLPPGHVGEIFMRMEGTSEPGYRYLGAPAAKQTIDGFVSVGDLGWVDEDGWVYSADRRVDMIITGGANVYPAEVEAAVSEHPAVRDVVVLGLPDEKWGKRVHAVIESEPSASPRPEALTDHCRERLAAYKIPKTWEFVEQLPRTSMGKIRRSSLVAERVGE